MTGRYYKFDVRRCAYENLKDVYSLLCNSAENQWGEEIMLHNELDLVFRVVDGKIQIVEGWHVGTESFALLPGDEDKIEYYHPGITEQILDKMKEE